MRTSTSLILAALLGAAGLPLKAPATTVVPPSFTQLVGASGYVVRAVVTNMNAEWQHDGGNLHIITRVTFEVREVIAGTPPEPLVLTMLGGKIGDTELLVDGAPRFKVGDEDILFVRGPEFKLLPFVAMQYGQYLVQRDAKTRAAFVTRSNGRPLFSADEVAQPLGVAQAAMAAGAKPLTPEAFAASIRRAFQTTHQPKQKMVR